MKFAIRFAACIALFAAEVLSAGAQEYPNKGIRVAVGATPGGPLDTVMRLVGDRMKDTLGQPILVDNRPGAGGMISFDVVRSAPPDGYTLLMSHPGLSAAKFMFKAFTADPMKDFTHIGLMTTIPIVVAVNADSPYKSMAEFLAFAKANPGKITMGSLTGPYVMDVALLQALAGIQVTTVQYQGTAQQQVALAAGQIAAATDPYAGAKGFAEQGKTRLIGVGTPKRFGLIPEVPAIAELVPGYEANSNFFGLSGPAGLPPGIVAKLSASLRAALNAPDIKKRLNGIGFDVIASGPEEFREFLARDIERTGKAAALAGITPQ